jgi:hypothetical protein
VFADNPRFGLPPWLAKRDETHPIDPMAEETKVRIEHLKLSRRRASLTGGCRRSWILLCV